MTTVAHTHVTVPRGMPGGLIGSMLVGVIGALFGLGGFLAVVVGDEMIALDGAAVAAGVLAAAALAGAIAVSARPLYAAVAMTLAPLWSALAFGNSWSTWWSRYQDAIATSGAAENAFWSAMPALALFAVSAALVVSAAILAFVHVFTTDESAPEMLGR